MESKKMWKYNFAKYLNRRSWTWCFCEQSLKAILSMKLFLQKLIMNQIIQETFEKLSSRVLNDFIKNPKSSSIYCRNAEKGH